MTTWPEVETARAALGAGRLVVVPTDTVYGLAARPDSPEAVARVFELKGRPAEKPLPVLAARLEDLRGVIVQPRGLRALAARFWPGPLTVVVERAAGFTSDLGGDSSSIAVRVPDHRVARDLLRHSGPLAVTSANRSGEAPATTVAEARGAFGASVAAYLDAGRCDGMPSTIVSLVGVPKVLRQGALPAHEVLEALPR